MLHQPLPTSLQVSVTLPQQCSTKILQLRHSGQSHRMGLEGTLEDHLQVPWAKQWAVLQLITKLDLSKLLLTGLWEQLHTSAFANTTFGCDCPKWVADGWKVRRLFYVLQYFTHLCSLEVWMLFFCCFIVFLKRLLFTLRLLLIFTNIPHPDYSCVNCSFFFSF